MRPCPAGPRPIPSGGVAPASITNVQIANNAVTGANIVDGSITIADLAAPPSAAFAGGDQLVRLSVTHRIFRSVSLTAPAAGRVIVNASGFFNFLGSSSDAAWCSITTGTIVDIFQEFLAQEATSRAMQYVPFAGTRGFTVAAGAHTFNLVCIGTSSAYVGDSSLTGDVLPGLVTCCA
jgi:hypothetical protein